MGRGNLDAAMVGVRRLEQAAVAAAAKQSPLPAVLMPEQLTALVDLCVRMCSPLDSLNAERATAALLEVSRVLLQPSLAPTAAAPSPTKILTQPIHPTKQVLELRSMTLGDDQALARAVRALAPPVVAPDSSPTIHLQLLAALARPEYLGRVQPPRVLYKR